MGDVRKLIEAVERGEPPVTWRAFKSDERIAMLAGEAFHGSLDAAKALHDALLPGWKWGVGFGVTIGFASVCPRSQSPRAAFTVEHTDPARAWLLAILRALEGEP